MLTFLAELLTFAGLYHIIRCFADSIFYVVVLSIRLNRPQTLHRMLQYTLFYSIYGWIYLYSLKHLVLPALLADPIHGGSLPMIGYLTFWTITLRYLSEQYNKALIEAMHQLRYE